MESQTTVPSEGATVHASHPLPTKKTIILLAIAAASIIAVAVTAAVTLSHNSASLAVQAAISVKSAIPGADALAKGAVAHTITAVSRVAAAERKRVAAYFAIGVVVLLIVGALIGLAVFLAVFDGVKVLTGLFKSDAVVDGGGEKVVAGDVENGSESKVKPTTEDIQPKPKDQTPIPIPSSGPTPSPGPETEPTETKILMNVKDWFVSFLFDSVGPWLLHAIRNYPMISAFIIFSIVMGVIGLARKQTPLAMVGPALATLYGVYVSYGAIVAALHSMWITALILGFVRIILGRSYSGVNPGRAVMICVSVYNAIVRNTVCALVDTLWYLFLKYVWRKREARNETCLVSKCILISIKEEGEEPISEGDIIGP